jgi:hypothetical protein
MPAVTLEAEEWYVLENWLRERENRLMYALRPKSGEWTFVHDLRRAVERQQEPGGEPPDTTEAGEAAGMTSEAETAREAETAGTTATVRLSDRQVTYLSSYLRRRARKLLLLPWRSRERRDVRHLRDHVLAEARPGGDPDAKTAASDRSRE